jgi:hypothetical protein
MTDALFHSFLLRENKAAIQAALLINRTSRSSIRGQNQTALPEPVRHRPQEVLR